MAHHLDDVGGLGRSERACAECGGDKVLEIDHALAISVAVELGPRAVMRAFMPDNLQNLCHDCHARKTTRDRRLLKILRDGIAPPPTPPAIEDLPMFAWQAGAEVVI